MNASQNNGAVLLVDASKYKIQPDSFSATLPIWCAVLNQLVPFYKRHVNHVDEGLTYQVLSDGMYDANWWEDSLFTPPCISPTEYEKMKSVIPDRVRAVIESKVILDPKAFLDKMKKPLRCFWIENSGDYETNMKQVYNNVRKAQAKYMCIVCISCSDPEKSRKDDGYISGAGDDEESWANGLTPTLLWEHRDEILSKGDSEKVQRAIDSLVNKAKSGNEEWFRSRTGALTNSLAHANGKGKVRPCFTSYFDIIGSTRISIGTRRSGRPPDCWDHFDAVVNVTTMEYAEMSSDTIPDGKFYLQLPVKEGKRDRSELEKWMAIAMLFIGVHAASHQRRVLIHCAQGMDRSVAIAMAAICIYFPQVFTTKYASNLTGSDGNMSTSSIFEAWTENIEYSSIEKFMHQHNTEVSMDPTSNDKMYKASGIPQKLVEACMGREGRDLFFSYVDHLQKQSKDCTTVDSLSGDKVFANKETLRLALVFIHQFRPKACPTRSTMQKLNRFFMSGFHEPA